MELTNQQKIGTHFNKENIFLATVFCTEKNIKLGLSDEVKEKILRAGVNVSDIEMFDIFYKDGDIYLRFFLEGVETYAGDNSDGMGVLRNIVSVWDYFSEDELFEEQLSDGSMAIGFTNEEALNMYNRKYNFDYKSILEVFIGE